MRLPYEVLNVLHTATNAQLAAMITVVILLVIVPIVAVVTKTCEVLVACLSALRTTPERSAESEAGES